MFDLKTFLQWGATLVQTAALAALAVVADQLNAVDLSQFADRPMLAIALAVIVPVILRAVNYGIAKLPS